MARLSKRLVHSHTASQWLSQNSNPESPHFRVCHLKHCITLSLQQRRGMGHMTEGFECQRGEELLEAVVNVELELTI